jgi:hypothetical protein
MAEGPGKVWIRDWLLVDFMKRNDTETGASRWRKEGLPVLHLRFRVMQTWVSGARMDRAAWRVMI